MNIGKRLLALCVLNRHILVHNLSLVRTSSLDICLLFRCLSVVVEGTGIRKSRGLESRWGIALSGKIAVEQVLHGRGRSIVLKKTEGFVSTDSHLHG